MQLVIQIIIVDIKIIVINYPKINNLQLERIYKIIV